MQDRRGRGSNSGVGEGDGVDLDKDMMKKSLNQEHVGGMGVSDAWEILVSGSG